VPDLPRFEIIRESEFEEQLERLFGDMEEADKFTLGAEFILAREPRDGLPASRDGSIWYLPMNQLRGRAVSLYYTFDERAVTFLFIVAFDE